MPPTTDPDPKSAPAPPTPIVSLKDRNREIARLAANADRLKDKADAKHQAADAAKQAWVAAIGKWRDAVLDASPQGGINETDDEDEPTDFLAQ
jgi:hypothetical protein